jgi:hypothetical protein
VIKSMAVDVAGILSDIGITNATSIMRGPPLRHCELWQGESDSVVSRIAVRRVLVLHSGFSNDNVDLLIRHVSNVNIVLFENSLPKIDINSAVQNAFPHARILTVGNALRQTTFKDFVSLQASSVEYYVPPTIVLPTGPTSANSAIITLFQWLQGTDRLPTIPSRVGVLLAPAGTGKTALATELTNYFHNKYPVETRQRQTASLPFPLLVDRLSWIEHEFRDETDNLAELIGHALYRRYGSAAGDSENPKSTALRRHLGASRRF